jgi:UDP-N-acetylmuramyl pentapeptide phosphotransferase/UDP-N-acetylglucosamine-1-phosphate transferase
MQANLPGSAFAPALALVLALAVLRLLLLPATQRWFLDHPNPRSLHASPIPRTGGVAVIFGALAGMLWIGDTRLVVIPTLGLFLLSVFDDWRSLPASVRLLGHLAAAFGFAYLAFPSFGILVLLLLGIGVGWMTNLYNFMDGADGLAGGMALFGFTFYAIAAWTAGQPAFALASLCVAAAAVAFLLFNFPPARIFMGDGGSIPLGFLAAALGLTGWRDGLWPLWFPVAVFAPFVLDASVTLARRALRGEAVWRAHRTHYYQRLILAGWSHRRTALSEYALMAVSGCLALLALEAPMAVRAVLLAGLAGVYAFAMLTVDRRSTGRAKAAP